MPSISTHINISIPKDFQETFSDFEKLVRIDPAYKKSSKVEKLRGRSKYNPVPVAIRVYMKAYVAKWKPQRLEEIKARMKNIPDASNSNAEVPDKNPGGNHPDKIQEGDIGGEEDV